MTLNTQLMTMLVMAMMGFEFAAAYDTYMRVFRRTLSRKFTLLICDINFMIGQAALLYYLLYKVNHGEIRIYIVIALFCGYAIYQTLFRQIYRVILEKLIKIVIVAYKICRQVVFVFIVKPVKQTVKLIVGCVKLIWKIMVNFSKGLYFIAKRGVKVVILIVYKLFSPTRMIVKIIPIKYRIKSMAKLEKILLLFKNVLHRIKKK